MEIVHVPVMREEVLDSLNIKRSGIYVDATVGLGGHAAGIMERSSEKSTVIGIDRDDRALEIAGERLGRYKNVHLIRHPFSDIAEAVKSSGFDKVDGVLLDIGVSTLQLKSEGTGFSFMRDEALDMRMDRRQELTAEDIVNSYREKELADIIWKYGEERYSRRIARAITYARRRQKITSCSELAGIIERSIGRRGRIHPATRTFQALRIEVNSELEELALAIDSGMEILGEGGRLCVLSYHSLEDRIVKNAFKKLAREGLFKIITKKPLVPGRDETRSNPPSRSAKLRVGEKI